MVTYFYRYLFSPLASWAPNGSHIAAANAVNGMQCVAAVISRDNWSSDLSLVGHELPVEVAVSVYTIAKMMLFKRHS